MAISTGAAILGGSIIGGGLGLIGSDRAADAAVEGSEAGIAEQRRQFNTLLELTQPGRQVGNAALNTLAQMFIPGFEGIAGAGGGVPAPAVAGVPGTGTGPATDGSGGRFGDNFVIQPDGSIRQGLEPTLVNPPPPEAEGGLANNLSSIFRNLPGVGFLVDESTDEVQANFAAGGDRRGGNVLRAIADRTSNIAESQVTNRLLQLAGFGPQATGQAVAGTQNTSNNISSLLQGIGAANAGGISGGFQSLNNAVQGGLNNFLLMQALNG